MGFVKDALKKFEALKVDHDQKKQAPPQGNQPQKPAPPARPQPPPEQSAPAADQGKQEEQHGFSRPRAKLPPRKRQQVLGNPTIFTQAIATEEPPTMFSKLNHAVVPQGCKTGEHDPPLQTNNFATNLALEDQSFPIWPLPYSLWVAREPDQMPGMAFNHTEALQRVFGPDPNQNPAQYFFNPPRIKLWVISGQGLAQGAPLEIEYLNKFAASTKFKVGSGSITMPFVQGMGFVTAIYEGVAPVLGLAVGIQQFDKCGTVDGRTKYVAKLFNQVQWSVYVSGGELRLDNPNTVTGTFTLGVIQVARGVDGAYDETAGVWPTDIELSGSRDSYTFNYQTAGSNRNNNTLVWLLPHHYEILDAGSAKGTSLLLDSPCKGVMKAFVTQSAVTMKEKDLPEDILFDPWSPSHQKSSFLSGALDKIRAAATEEVQQDVVGMANIDSMYTLGKILDKFAYIAYVCKYILKDDGLVLIILPKLKEAINIFATNHQKFPLKYDSTWKGILSSADPGADFGNSNYNDHHFHYGYHIHAIALTAKVEPTYFADCPEVLAYVKALARDVALPVADDWFPQFRLFDWFHGHLWAHGIFASGDGKNEELSLEDYHCYYGLKLLAEVLEDGALEARSNLMLAIMRRSINKYMLYLDGNKEEPSNFVGNRVAGISFENKIDYSTFFGRGSVGDEWIHGIHMLPTTPISGYMRSASYVQQEWDQWLAPVIDRVEDGWRGMCMLNYGLYDAKKAYQFFAQDGFNNGHLDNGMSRTWSLAFLAGIGGA